MSEALQPNPETQNQPDQNPELGLLRSAMSWLSTRRQTRRIDRLEVSIRNHEVAIKDSLESQEVNKVTGAYTITTGPDLLTKLPDHVKLIDAAHKGELRPSTQGERRVRRKTERALKANTRRAGVVYDLNTAYGRKDPSHEPQELPDRKPGVGNQERRAKVDEAMRRAGLLTDQQPQEPQQLFKLGTPEHRATVSGERLRPKERVQVGRVERKATSYSDKVDKNVDFVENVAAGTDKSAKRHEKKRAKLQRKIAAKNEKLNRLQGLSPDIPNNNSSVPPNPNEPQGGDADTLRRPTPHVASESTPRTNITVTVETPQERHERLKKEREKQAPQTKTVPSKPTESAPSPADIPKRKASRIHHESSSNPVAPEQESSDSTTKRPTPLNMPKRKKPEGDSATAPDKPKRPEITVDVSSENLEQIRGDIAVLAAKLAAKESETLTADRQAELVQKATNLVVGSIVRKKYGNSSTDGLTAEQQVYTKSLKDALESYESDK